MPTGDLLNGTIKLLFTKEIINKEVKNAKVVDEYIPNVNEVPITSKFYSKYDSVVIVEDQKKHEKYLVKADRAMRYGPRDKYKQPMTGNQEYGWIPGPLIKYDQRDEKLFRYPKLSNEITLIGEKIALSKVTEREHFTGTPFSFRFNS